MHTIIDGQFQSCVLTFISGNTHHMHTHHMHVSVRAMSQLRDLGALFRCTSRPPRVFVLLF